jgi:hypothetical protein
MSYALRLLVVAGAALALTSCGSSSKSENAANTTQSQAAQSGGATGVTGASGASGATSSQTAPKKKKGSAGDVSRANGTGGSGVPANTSGGSGSSGGGGAGDQTAIDQQKSDTAAQRKARRKARRKRDAAPFFTSKQVYKQGKGGCHLLGVNAIAREYRAASFKPKDVASAYADAWVKGGAPERSRKAMFRGCLAGLKDNLAGR